MIVYLLCFILFLVGLYGVITRRNLVKIAISMSFMEFSTFLLFALIGYVDGGSETVIDAFLEVVGEGGTVVVPTCVQYVNGHRASVEERRKVWDINKSSSDMGLITETFRKRRDSLQFSSPLPIRRQSWIYSRPTPPLLPSKPLQRFSRLVSSCIPIGLVK